MVKIKHIQLIALAVLLLGAGTAQAQWSYVTDNPRGDSVVLYERVPVQKPTDKRHTHLLGDKALCIANGEQLTIAKEDSMWVALSMPVKDKTMPDVGDDSRNYVTVTIKGKKYFVETANLIPIDKDAAKPPFKYKGAKKHSAMGHWYYTATPYWLIAVCIVLSIALCFAAGRSRMPWLLVLPSMGLLLLGVVLEIMAVWYIGGDVVWWTDKATYGFWPVIFRILLLALVVVAQIFSMRLVSGIVGDDDMEIWKPILSALKGFGVLVVFVLIDGLFIHDGSWPLVAGLAAALVVLAIGLVKSIKTNSESVGNVLGGTVFTLFAVVWSIGVAIGVVIAVIGLIKVFLELLITIAIAVGAMFAMGSVMGNGSNSGGGSSRVMRQNRTFYDASGKGHASFDEATRANQDMGKGDAGVSRVDQ